MPEPIDPDLREFFNRSREEQAAINLARRAMDRIRRLREAWRSLAAMRSGPKAAAVLGKAYWLGDSAKAYWRAYAARIIELGKLLREDGWQAAVDAVVPRGKAQTTALNLLRLAMADNRADLETLMQEPRGVSLRRELQVYDALEQALMLEVLKLGRTAGGEEGAPRPTTDRPRRDPLEPSPEEQAVILAVWEDDPNSIGPLDWKKIKRRMRLERVGKLRQHLAWMVSHGKLIHARKGRADYWPAHLSLPE
jgi:hypothetical protein